MWEASVYTCDSHNVHTTTSYHWSTSYRWSRDVLTWLHHVYIQLYFKYLNSVDHFPIQDPNFRLLKLCQDKNLSNKLKRKININEFKAKNIVCTRELYKYGSEPLKWTGIICLRWTHTTNASQTFLLDSSRGAAWLLLFYVCWYDGQLGYSELLWFC